MDMDKDLFDKALDALLDIEDCVDKAINQLNEQEDSLTGKEVTDV